VIVSGTSDGDEVQNAPDRLVQLPQDQNHVGDREQKSAAPGVKTPNNRMGRVLLDQCRQPQSQYNLRPGNIAPVQHCLGMVAGNRPVSKSKPYATELGSLHTPF